MGLLVAGVAQFGIDSVNLVLDVLEILLSESLILEDDGGASLFEDGLAEPLQVVVEEVSAQDILVDPLAELHDLLQLLAVDVVALWVGLSHHEHLVVLLPEGLEVRVLHDDQIHDVESLEDFAKVVKDLEVDHLLEAVVVDLVFGVEQTVHLVDDVLRQVNDPSNYVEELVVHLQRSANLQLLFA